MGFAPDLHRDKFPAESKLFDAKASVQNCSTSSAQRPSPGDSISSLSERASSHLYVQKHLAGLFDDSGGSQIKCTPPRVSKYPSPGHLNQITSIPAPCPPDRRYSTRLKHHRSAQHHLALSFTPTHLPYKVSHVFTRSSPPYMKRKHSDV